MFRPRALPSVLNGEDVCSNRKPGPTAAKCKLSSSRKAWLGSHRAESPPDTPPGERPTSFFGEETRMRADKLFGASNNWVVRSNDGSAAILANDPHLQLMAPSIWVLSRLQWRDNSGKEHKTSGASLIGLPGTVTGHNSNIAWGVTNTGVDVHICTR